MRTAAAKERRSSLSPSRGPKNRVRGLRPSRAPRVGVTGLPTYGLRWGNRFAYDGAASDQRYPGQYYDQESGLHYNYFRDYDPKTGRYIEPDPIGLAGGMNLYPYVENSPVNKIDPFGLQTMTMPFPGVPLLPPVPVPTPPNLTPRQWDDMRDFLGRFNPIPLLQYLRDKGSSIWDDVTTPATDSAADDSCPNDREDTCWERYQNETRVCNAISRMRGAAKGAICHRSATTRYGECKRFGRATTPLAGWD